VLKEAGERGRNRLSEVCSRGDKGAVRRAGVVTHYYVALLAKFDKRICHEIEGVCRFWIGKTEYLASHGRPTEKYHEAYCKNGMGYGPKTNCLNPCRTLAANRDAHPPGEVLFFPELVGKKCGIGLNAMVHDGFMVVHDNGALSHFNLEGRFDFFWGECRNSDNGVCRDPGAEEITKILSNSSYCRVWSPDDAKFNTHLKTALVNTVRVEAQSRGDNGSADSFDLDAWASR
jgi:hypothetical protein